MISIATSITSGAVRRSLKRVFGPWAATLLSVGLRFTKTKAGVALVYHTIASRQGDPSRELVPPTESARFSRQLRYLRRHYDVVPAVSIMDSVSGRRRGQRFPVCVTFDDDRVEHVRNALPLLSQENVQATFFLGGSALDRPRSTWWERLQRAFDRGFGVEELIRLLPDSCAAGHDEQRFDIHRLGALVERLQPAERDRFSEALLKYSGPDPVDAGLQAAGVMALVDAGHSIGFHTRRHDPLTRLDHAQLAQALNEGRSELAVTAGHDIGIVAYPHGLADGQVAAAALTTGFRLGFTTTSCAITPTADPMLLGRIGPVSESLGAFALRIVRILRTRPQDRRASQHQPGEPDPDVIAEKRWSSSVRRKRQLAGPL